MGMPPLMLCPGVRLRRQDGISPFWVTPVGEEALEDIGRFD
jgi:hypothetical protein